MKTWEPQHPKAKLMARKRADILAAAKRSFLEKGYEGTSMESIAKAAEVSIMTLYRHAKTKDDLFSAVIANACDPSDHAEHAAIEAFMRKPLAELLVTIGIFAQQTLSNPDTIALLRTVIAETTRFPHLAETTYGGLVGHVAEIVTEILRQKEGQKVSDDLRRRLAGQFVDRLMGSDILRILLGMPGLAPEEQELRARNAAEELILKIDNPST